MGELENHLTLKNLANAKPYLVPHIFSQNYYNILTAKLKNKKLTENETYYYNHFIKKKLKGMMDLLDISYGVNGKEFIRKDRLHKTIALLKKYSRKHKNMKVLIAGSFLYSEHYNDIDLFVISRYDKKDYKEGKVHVNYLPMDIEKTIFFKSIYAISVSNFRSDSTIEEQVEIGDIADYYEMTILFIMQKDDYLQELRDLVVKAEYASNNVVLNSMQLKVIINRITKSKTPIRVINKYLVAKIINSYSAAIIKRALNQFIEKNSRPEKGKKMHENWIIYNQTYREALEVVA
ncbi:MAG: hypothetical protein U9O94_05855 [Nanoarchaeota archaeon]|nr:hypothetical protein [Nanoarchaeota archaeon]